MVTFSNALVKLNITTMMIKGSIKQMIMHYPQTTWVWRNKFKTIYVGHVSNGNKKNSLIVHNFAKTRVFHERLDGNSHRQV